MKKIKNLTVILILLGLISSCTQKEPVSNDLCSLNLFLIDERDFPDKDLVLLNLLDGTEKSPLISRTYKYYNSDLWQFVAYYPTEEKAHNEFIEYTGTLFQDTETSSNWEVPESNFQSQVASEIKYACNNNGEFLSCNYSARYGNLHVFLMMHLTNDGFTKDDFIYAMKIIDKKLETCYLPEKQACRVGSIY